jgi:dihydrofolate reductase
MSPIVVQTFVTLDGVAQGPGAPDEDLEGGFEHGGWQQGYDLADLLLEWESKTEALLLGRKTYDIWSQAWAVWPEDAPGLMGEFTRRYNRVPKYIASHTQTSFDWKNSHHLGMDVPAAVRALQVPPGGEVRVWGSLDLIRTLAEADLVVEYRIITYPVVLGTGKKLFGDGFPVTKLALVSSEVHPSGVVVSIYRRA